MKTIFASPLRGLQPTEQLVKRKEIADDEGGMPTGDAVDQSLNNSTETIIPRERLDTQTPEVAEVVSYAMDYINKKVEPKRLARVINIINAFREKRTATDTVAYYTATLHLRRKNGRMEFQDIKVGRSLDSGSLTTGTVINGEPHDRGVRLALHSMVGFLGGAIGGPVVGFVLDNFGGQASHLAWFMSFLCLGLGSLLSALTFRYYFFKYRI